MLALQVFFIILSTCTTIATIYVFVHILIHYCCRTPEQIASDKRISKSLSPAECSISGDARTTNIATSTTTKQFRFFRNGTIICSTFFAIQILMANIDFFIWGFTQKDHAYKAATIICWTCYFCGHITLLYIFIGRLRHTFGGTPFAYSDRSISRLKMVCCLMPLLAIASLIAIRTSSGVGVGFVVGVICVTVFVFIDIVLSSVLLWCYLHKLYVLLKVTNDTSLIVITTKMSLLYTVCFASTLSCFLVIAIRAVERTQRDSEGSFLRIIFIFLSLDALLNSLCLWLRLNSAKQSYRKVCQTIHNAFEKCCRRFSNASVDMNHIVEQPAPVASPSPGSVEPSPDILDISKPKMVDLNSFEIRTTQNTAIIL
eukprot:554681_1